MGDHPGLPGPTSPADLSESSVDLVLVVLLAALHHDLPDVFGRQDRGHDRVGLVDRSDRRRLAQQAERLEPLRPLPGLALVQQGAELGPLVQQPLAAGGGRFQLVEDGRGVVGVGRQGGGTEGPADPLRGRLASRRNSR